MPDMTPALTASRVSKRFGAIKAVDDVSVTVGQGEIFALLGPNGAGKTTLIRMIIGLIKPDEGTVTRELGSTRGALGYLPEERGLYQDMPILRTLTYFGRLQGMPPRLASEAARSWLDRFDLGTRASEKVKALSKGNQQKVQFAAAILHKPKIAILDEPFSGLDPVNQDVFLDLIRELKDGGTTVIFSAHQMPLVERLADRVFLMSRGREVLHGSIPELRRRWHAGDRLVIGSRNGADTTFLREIDAVEAIEDQSAGEIRLRLKQGASISELLRAVGERMEVTYVRTEETTLHEIYVRTVEADRTSVADGGKP
jgi:ABC-2 type transport system ATP-binding protein